MHRSNRIGLLAGVLTVAVLTPGLRGQAPIGPPPATRPFTGDPKEAFRKILNRPPGSVWRSLQNLIKASPSTTGDIKAWTERHEALLAAAAHNAGFVPNGTAFATEDRKRIVVSILDHHASGKVIVYNLANERLTRAYWAGKPDAPLNVEFTGRDLHIEVTKKNEPMPDPLATVLVLEFAKQPIYKHPSIQPDGNGVLVIHAKDAIVHGQNLRYEPEPHKNTLGYWTRAEDWAQWSMVETKAGTYEVEVLQGCGKGHGGSDVEFHVGGTVLPMVVQDTGHFQNFVPRTIGRVKVDGIVEVKVVVKNKKGGAVMDLRQIVLKPVK